MNTSNSTPTVEILLKARKEGAVLIVAATQDPGAADEHSSIRGLVHTRIPMRHPTTPTKKPTARRGTA